MARVADGHGAAMVVIAPVYRDFLNKPEWGERMARLRAALDRAMEATEIPYLLIPELTEASYPENDGLFGEDIHPNVHGHRLMAARLLEFISDNGLLGDLRTSALERRSGSESGHHR
jgi:lysophospholipase L1-like esterase